MIAIIFNNYQKKEKYMKQKALILFANLCIAILPTELGCNNDLPEPYKSIQVLPVDNYGWFSQANKLKIEEFFKEYKPQTIVEIGSWMGVSTMFMASIAPENSVVYAVDHWLGSLEHRTEEYYKPKLPILYQQFLSNVIHANLTHKIIPMRMSSREAAATLNIEPDFIYIDGSHEEEDVYNDIMAWYPKLKRGGILCGDDYTWVKQSTGSVKRAIERAAKKLHIQTITAIHVFWYFPPKP